MKAGPTDSDFHITVVQVSATEIGVSFKLRRSEIQFSLPKDDWQILRKILGCGGASAEQLGIRISIDDRTY